MKTPRAGDLATSVALETMPSAVSGTIRLLRRSGPLLLVLVVGGALRFGAVGYGLPRHDLGQDELITAGRVLRGPLRGTPGAPTYNWPNLTIHLSRLAVDLTRRVESVTGWPRRDEFLIGRVLVATICTSALLWLYLAARGLFDHRIGVLSSALLAVMPLHAFRSRLWVPDGPMTTFYTLTWLAAVGILRRPTLVRFLAAGVGVGLATASKYNGAGACLPVLVAAWLARGRLPEPARWRRLATYLAAAAAVALLTFFAADPLALVNFRAVLAGATWVGGHYQTEATTGPLGWYTLVYLAQAFFSSGHEGLGPYLSLLSLAGMAILARRRSPAGTLVWLPALLYLLVFGTALRTPFERTFLPLLPHLATAAAVAVAATAAGVDRWLRRRGHHARAATPILLVAVLAALPPVASQTRAARRGDTRLEALRWIEEQLPAGATVIREWDMVPVPSRLFQTRKQTAMLCGLGLTPPQMAKRFDYVVLSSASFRWVLRQRTRPGFRQRVECYEAILEGPDFELRARFEPDPSAFGPEIRVYQTRPARGPRFGARRTRLDLGPRAWASSQRLLAGRSTGVFELQRPIDLLAGPVVVTRPGRYRLSARVQSDESFPVEIRLGGVRQDFRVRGARLVALDQQLPVGQVWWRIGVGPGPLPPSAAGISELSLTKVPEQPPASAGGSAPAPARG